VKERKQLMFWFLLGWWFGSAKHDEPERPRYFRESPPREETKEEKKARVVFLIALCMLAIGTLIISQDIGYRLLDVVRALS
jgi:hypothetical protein